MVDVEFYRVYNDICAHNLPWFLRFLQKFAVIFFAIFAVIFYCP